MIVSVNELEACVGAPSLPVKMKVINHLDTHAKRWICGAPFLAAAVAGDDVRVTLGGGEPGFVLATDETSLVVKRSSLDDVETIRAGEGIALLFFAPETTETLRVNGRVSNVTAVEVTVRIEECFVHCGKALIRSAFWQPPAPPLDALAAAHFFVLGTADAHGNADASPKGDPPGSIVRLNDHAVALPDRTGNRRADGHRNVIANDRIAFVAFAPGSTKVFAFRGRAHLSRDADLLGRMAVEGKAPQLATVIAIRSEHTYRSAAIERARLWDRERRAAGERPNPAAALAAHVKLNQSRGVDAPAARLLISAAATERALARDYKENLW